MTGGGELHYRRVAYQFGRSSRNEQVKITTTTTIITIIKFYSALKGILGQYGFLFLYTSVPSYAQVTITTRRCFKKLFKKLKIYLH